MSAGRYPSAADYNATPEPEPVPLPRPLTVRQAEVLVYLRDHIATRGYAPTLREIGRYLGIKSTNGVNDHLRALIRKGYITRPALISRAIVLTEAAYQDALPIGSFEFTGPPVRGVQGKGTGD